MSTLYSTSINLGSSATFDAGTSANNIVQLDSNAKLPAVDGSQLTNLGITGSLVYRGVYNATTNNPVLTSASKGDFYKVSVQGTLAGVALNVNDHIIFNQDASSPITSAMFDVIDNTETSLATVASTGSYNDLINKPSLVSGLNDLSDCTTAGASNNQVLVHNGAVFTNAQLDYNQVANTPSLSTVATSGSYNDLSNKPTLGTASALDVGTGANEIVQLNGSSQLPALDGSLLTSITGTDNTKLAIANDLNDLNNVATARTNLGLATVANTGSYNDLSNKPTLGTASALDVGTGANEIVQLNASSQLPALDGSLLTNLPSGGGGGFTYQARDTTTPTHSPLVPVANYHYSINANSANFVINLNALSSYSVGDQIRIKLQAQTGSNNITINPNGSDTIDGQNSASPTTLTVLYQAVTLVRGSTEWEVI